MIDECFGATVEATEEAVVDALFVADTVVGRHGRTVPGLPVERVLELVGRPHGSDQERADDADRDE